MSSRFLFFYVFLCACVSVCIIRCVSLSLVSIYVCPPLDLYDFLCACTTNRTNRPKNMYSYFFSSLPFFYTDYEIHFARQRSFSSYDTNKRRETKISYFFITRQALVTYFSFSFFPQYCLFVNSAFFSICVWMYSTAI